MRVAVTQDERLTGYPENAPFRPSTAYPEYPFRERGLASADEGRVYDLVRRSFRCLGLDAEHFDTPDWNPLGELIRPGDTVVVKPNMVLHRHGWGWDVRSVITHGSVVRAVIDYVAIALGRHGRIIVGDAPLQSADFDAVVAIAGLDRVIEFYRTQGIGISLVDFRRAKSQTSIDGMLTSPTDLEGDPRGSTPVDLGDRSCLSPLARDHRRYRVTCYDPEEMSRHHNLEVNEYLIANSILQADAVISIPKMKTHRKVGITSALKNLVGINGHKDWLPHHRQGSADEGGDEYRNRDRLKAALSRMFDRENAAANWASGRAYYYPRRLLGLAVRHFQRDPFFEGSWYGNDTAWRMVLDLNRILTYASKHGEIRDTPQRRVMTVVDGIVAGEGEGPLEPHPRHVGVVIAGNSAAAVDAVIARMMGFDHRAIPLIRRAFELKDLPIVSGPPDEVEIVSDLERWNGLDLNGGNDSLRFEPPIGWKGRIELESVRRAAPPMPGPVPEPPRFELTPEI